MFPSFLICIELVFVVAFGTHDELKRAIFWLSKKLRRKSSFILPQNLLEPIRLEISAMYDLTHVFHQGNVDRQKKENILSNQVFTLEASNPGLFVVSVAPAGYSTDADSVGVTSDKISSFYRKILEQYNTTDPLELRVHHGHVVKDSLAAINFDWKRRIVALMIKDDGTEFPTGTGSVKAWVTLLSQVLFNPDLGLFVSIDGVSVRIRPAISMPRLLIDLYRLAGLILGKAIVERVPVPVKLGRGLLLELLDRFSEATCGDHDYVYYHRLESIPDPIDNNVISFTMPVGNEHVALGLDETVTDENREVFLKLVCDNTFLYLVDRQTRAFLDGFHSVISSRKFSSWISPSILQSIISGSSQIDVNDWKNHSVFMVTRGENGKAPLIYKKWFWSILETDFDNMMRRKLLLFTTGMYNVPYGGFKNLHPQFAVNVVAREDSDHHLAFSDLTRNTLFIPTESALQDREYLKQKLLAVLTEGYFNHMDSGNRADGPVT